MADLDFTVNADTSAAQRNLKSLENSVSSLEGVMTKLKSAVAGLALGSIISQAIQMADALTDTAVAAGLSAQALLGFSEALAQNGGDFNKAQMGALAFNQSIAEAAAGSAKTQKTFAELGISLNDLARLSEEDLLRKTVEGLGRVADNSKRAAIGQELFGKAAKGVDFRGVARDIDSITEAQARNAAAVESAGAVSDQLGKTYRTLQVELLNALKPISDFLAALDPKAIGDFIQTIIALGKVLVVVTVFSKVTDGLNDMIKTFRNASVASGGMFAALSSGGGSISTALAGIKQLGQAFDFSSAAVVKTYTGFGIFTQTLRSLLGGFSKLLPLIGQIWAGFEILNGVLKVFFGFDLGAWIDKAGQSLAKLLGLSYKTSAEKEKEAAAQQKATKAAEDAAVAEGGKRREVEAAANAFGKQVAEIQKGVDAYKASNDEVLKRLTLEGQLIGLSEQEKAVKQALFDFEKSNLSKLAELRQQYNTIFQNGSSEEKKILPEIQKAINDVTAAYQSQKTEVEALVRANQTNLELQRQAQALADFATKTQSDNASELRKIQDDMAKITMTEIEKKYYDIARAAEESATRAIEAENARRKAAGIDPMTQAEMQKYYDTANAKTRELQAAQQKSYDYSRTWSTGWKKAFKEYAEAATDNSKKAENIFKKATQGMEDMIVNFAKTGKLEWKSFVSSILEELLRGQIQSGIASVLGPIGEFLGLDLGGLGGGAKGNTPNNPMYVSSVNGGIGGGGAGGIIGAASDIFGGGSNGSGGGFGQIIDWGTKIVGGLGDFGSTIIDGIGSIFGGGGGGGFLSSIGDFFGGFLANGGTLPAGKFGIVGERGPELISGPASITPMNMGGSVTYNINAVDAASFKELVARDPGFIHAVASQGGRSIATRR